VLSERGGGVVAAAAAPSSAASGERRCVSLECGPGKCIALLRIFAFDSHFCYNTEPTGENGHYGLGRLTRVRETRGSY
jgi:hypothetical protein